MKTAGPAAWLPEIQTADTAPHVDDDDAKDRAQSHLTANKRHLRGQQHAVTQMRPVQGDSHLPGSR
jgi:hypothetical protein